MFLSRSAAFLIAVTLSPLACAQAGLNSVTKVTTEPDGRFFVDGTPVFPIGFTQGPPPEGKTPAGVNGMKSLAHEGFAFQQWQCPKGKWGPAKEAELDAIVTAAGREGMHVVIWIGDLEDVQPSDKVRFAEVRRVTTKYRNDPAIFLWKGVDEPQWGKIPADHLRGFYELVHKLDPNHPVWVTQAPRGTAADLEPYSKYFDVGAIDIYPVSYPPGMHSGNGNLHLSSVGDYTLEMRKAVDYKEPVMMTLQICFSGVIKPGKTLRFPTFPDERYMSYQAIIDGARALLYFGGALPQCQNERDQALGWNWTFYDRVLRPVLDEFSPSSPLYPALIAPSSKLNLHTDGGARMEYTVREAGPYIYLLAAEREGDTVQVKFSNLPLNIDDGEVLFEAPRHIKVAEGGFTDWFGPEEVHVYRFRKP
jgi:hypothetical protein